MATPTPTGNPFDTPLSSEQQTAASAQPPQAQQPQSDNPFDTPLQSEGSAATPDQPGVLSRAYSAVKSEVAPVIDAAKSVVTPPQDHKEQIAHAVGGLPALQVYRAARTVVNGLESTIKAPAEKYNQAKEDFQRGVRDMQNGDYRNVASDVVSTASDVAGIGPSTVPSMDRTRELSEGARPGGDLVTPIVKTGLDVGTALALDHVFNAATGKIEPVTQGTPKETAVAEATSKSGISAGTPETVAPTGEDIQPNLHQGIRDFVNKTHADAGLPPVPDKVGVLDVPQRSADAFTARSQATFQQVEDITKINPTNLKQIMAARADQIENLLAAGKEEEAGNLQQLQLNDANRMEKAFTDAKAKGVDVEQARSDWNKSLRADELSNAVRGSKSNISTLAKPDIDPNKLTSRLQKLAESQPGGKTAKLSQLGGDDNATNLVEHAENARDAARAIKEFVPQSATGQQALSKIISNNTVEKTGVLGRGKITASTDWNGVVKDIGNLTPEEQKAFGGELAQVRQYAGKQALKQNALDLLLGKTPVGKVVRLGIAEEAARRSL